MRTTKISIFFTTFTLISFPLLAQEIHWVDEILPYILFDLAFVSALYIIFIIAKNITKLLTVESCKTEFRYPQAPSKGSN